MGKMAEWKKATLGTGFSDEIAQIINVVSNVSSLVSTPLETVKTGLETASSFIVDEIDPTMAAIQLALSATIDIVNDLKNAGVYMLVVHPYTDGIGTVTKIQVGDNFTYVPSLSTNTLIQSVVAAFDDDGDLGRPTITNANVSARFFIATAPDVSEFASLLKLISQFLNIEEIENLAERLSRIVNAESDASLVPPSVAPDFLSVRISKMIPVYGDFLSNVADQLNGLYEMGEKGSGAINEIVRFLDKKIKQIDELILKIDAVVSKLNAGINATGLYVLKVDELSGGTNNLKTVIQSADGLPSGDVFSAGVLFLSSDGIAEKAFMQLLA